VLREIFKNESTGNCVELEERKRDGTSILMDFAPLCLNLKTNSENLIPNLKVNGMEN
jgi:hypothetical protein